ncbi:MAG: ParB N-terminal domain-containing protein [Planctomycetaceae bacterium]|nr:ParB N-terminal domain-containing protein [Planctomycetaceae bacterium]
MKIVRMKVSELKEAPYNPRKRLVPGSPEYERLAKSMSEFDLVQPLVWNRRTGHLVGGHQRCQILRDRKVKEVEVVEVELSLEREKALNIALNNSRIGSDWDLEKLTDVLEELQNSEEIELEATGFTEGDLRDLKLEPVEVLEESEIAKNEVEVRLWFDVGRWDAVSQREVDRLVKRFGVRVRVLEGEVKGG